MEYDSSPPKSRHTKFLDLTNGEGGEHPKAYSQDEERAETAPAAPPTAAPTPSIAGRGRGSTSAANSSATGSAANRRSDPNTPGKVVESGQEHTGRWTKEEHDAFLSALKMYGKEWKKVAAKVKTRTVVQTRTHAQKYFQKLQKAMGESKEDITHVEMGVVSKALRANALTQKKKPRLSHSDAVAPPPPKGARQTSVTSAAHLISNLSAPPGEVGGGSGYHLAAPSVASSSGFAKPQLPTSGHHKASLFPPQHGFSTFSSAPSGESTFVTPFSSSSSSFKPHGGTKSFSSMKIVAPEHDAALKRGKFPEPSPAACGKRKLAEIAAARMLAGVAASGPTSSALVSTKPGLLGMSSGVEDGTATPPPEDDAKAAELKTIPVPPIPVDKDNSAPGRKGFGLSLQIVNPESLGVSYEDQQKRRRDGLGSPVTPWEGELQALVSEDKKKGPEKEEILDIPRAPEIDGFGSSSSPHAVCGPGGAFNRNPLHKAVCEMDLAVIQSELATRPPDFFQRPDSKGFCPLHSACSLCMKNSQNSSLASDIALALINAGADVTVTDSEGNSPLHWAARAGDKGTVEALLHKHSPRDAKNDRGETPLHWASRAGRIGITVATVLLENGARPAVWSKEFKRPIDVAADGFHDESNPPLELKKLVGQRKRLTKEQRNLLKDSAEQRKEVRAHLLRMSVQSRTLVLHHPECLEHIPKAASDWECPDRVTSIVDRLLGKDIKANAPRIHEHEIALSKKFDKAELKVLSRVHSTYYLSFVNDLSKKLEREHKEMTAGKNGDGSDSASGGKSRPPVVPFTPMVQRTMIKVAESNVKQGQHSDTSFSVGSLRAARRAAGAVQHAVDCVLIGRNRNAFCIVRPPGHHAGISGLLEGGESCGFCIFNSVAAGAMHAISDERLLCERCAIVDIDVHHGNGTEEIVRKCHDPSKLFFFSIHLYDNEKKGKRESKSFQYKFYPGTGNEDDVALNIINVPIAPLWKEKEQPAASSNTHNTRNRARKSRSVERDDGGDSSETGRIPSDAEPEQSRGVSSGSTTPTTPNVGGSLSGRRAYRRAIQNRLLPALRAFNPDLILISAGFDACKNDVGNAKHEFGGKEKMGIDLEPEDYAWTTRKILEIADICCQGRVVSVLEGGYGRTPTAAASPSSDDSNEPLDKSLFSECAVRHIHAMIDPYDTEARFGSSSSKNDP